MPTELEEKVIRLTAQSAALIAVLQKALAGDGEPILNHARWEMYQRYLNLELAAKGLGS